MAEAATIRIYVVDPHPIVRVGLVSVITKEKNMMVCGEAGSAADALRGIMQEQPHVVIASMCLPGDSGLGLIKNAKPHSPNTRFIVLSSQPESIYAMRVLKAGGLAYVMKSAPIAQLLEAIRSVAANRVFVSSDMNDRMLANFVGSNPSHSSSIDALSDRELDVMNLIGNGLPTREIAKILRVGVKTVETHRSHLKKKLHIEGSIEFVQYCARWVDENAMIQIVSQAPFAHATRALPKTSLGEPGIEQRRVAS